MYVNFVLSVVSRKYILLLSTAVGIYRCNTVYTPVTDRQIAKRTKPWKCVFTLTSCQRYGNYPNQHVKLPLWPRPPAKSGGGGGQRWRPQLLRTPTTKIGSSRLTRATGQGRVDPQHRLPRNSLTSIVTGTNSIFAHSNHFTVIWFYI